MKATLRFNAARRILIHAATCPERAPLRRDCDRPGHNGLTASAYLARAGLRTLVVERRDRVGGCAVTELIAPGCRASTASYIASILRPKVIRDLGLAAHGLRLVPCDPLLQVARPDGSIVPWWADRDRMAAELRRLSDVEPFFAMDDDLKRLVVLRDGRKGFVPPGVSAAFRAARLASWCRSSAEASPITSIASSGVTPRRPRCWPIAYTARTRRPISAGARWGYSFIRSAAEIRTLQGFYGHVIGGMGAISEALAASARGYGAEIRTTTPVESIAVKDGRATGVVLADGTEMAAGSSSRTPTPSGRFSACSRPRPCRTIFGLP
jgi:glycine/D-amino acid oxidase-like deaminating enzyme